MNQPLTPARRADSSALFLYSRPVLWRGARWLAAAAAALLGACGTAPPAARVEPAPLPAPVARPAAPADARPAPAEPARVSAATTARAYRQSGASHLYGLNSDRVYKGRMPPMLHAVGVLNVEIDRMGYVTQLDWLRAPRHAPEVMAEIERMVRSAAPFPAPSRLGKVVYTDTWLWHKSGRFQLDTLTEGQD